MKRNYIILLISLFAMETVWAQSLVLDKVIGKVGREHILYSDVQELYNYARTQNPTYEPEVQCAIIDQLIAKKLLIDQAALDSVIISDVEVEIELDRRMDYVLRQMGGNEEQFYQYYGKTVLEQKEATREATKEQMLEQRVQGSLIKEVEITPKEVVAFFDRIPIDSLPYLNAEVELGEIAIKTIISPEVKNRAFEKISKVRSRIVDGGESFEELASLFSDDPGSATRGGDLGWAKRGSFVPEFEATGFDLEVNEISEVIETDFGYHFLQLLERRGNTIHLRHILVKPEITPEDIAYTMSKLDSIRMLLVADSLSFEIAVKRYSDDKTQSYNNAGRLINPETGDSFWETSQLDHRIYFAIENLQVGEYSEILEFEERDEKIFKIIKLQSKSRPHTASLSSDYARIKQYAKESKKNEAFNDWMEKKIANTYIELIDDLSVCPNLQKYLVSTDIKP